MNYVKPEIEEIKLELEGPAFLAMTGGGDEEDTPSGQSLDGPEFEG